MFMVLNAIWVMWCSKSQLVCDLRHSWLINWICRCAVFDNAHIVWLWGWFSDCHSTKSYYLGKSSFVIPIFWNKENVYAVLVTIREINYAVVHFGLQICKGNLIYREKTDRKWIFIFPTSIGSRLLDITTSL